MIDYEIAYKRAEEQRYKTLKLAFEILDLYVAPSTSPAQHEEYEHLKYYLLKRYEPVEEQQFDVAIDSKKLTEKVRKNDRIT